MLKLYLTYPCLLIHLTSLTAAGLITFPLWEDKAQCANRYFSAPPLTGALCVLILTTAVDPIKP